MRLLVIEDDPDLNRQLATALTDAGYVVDRAFDGEEGHYLGETEPYDAVILDIGLPKMDGISVLEAWRRAGRAMPVLILTARDRWSDKVQGFDAGADDYVAKPFHLEEVLARIRALLRRSAGHAKSELNCGRCGSTPAPAASPSTAIRSSSPATNTGCCPISCTTPAAWCRAPSWSSISTTRTSTATPTPSRCSSAASARSSASTSSRPCAGSAISSRRAGQCALTRSRCGCSSRRRPGPSLILVVTGFVLSSLYRAGGRARLRPPARRLSARRWSPTSRRPRMTEREVSADRSASRCSTCRCRAGTGR